MDESFTNRNRYVTMDSAPQSTYRSRKGEAKTTEHWGQRKLLLSEIDFLTLFYESAQIRDGGLGRGSTRVSYKLLVRIVLIVDLKFIYYHNI